MSSPWIELKGKTALVTGSGRGLGKAIALELANLGADIIVNDVQRENASQTASEVLKFGRKAWVSTHNIADYQQATELVQQGEANLGPIDILINNAGITRDALLHKLTEELWDEVINVNLKGTFNVGQACAKKMMERKSGRILNFASVAWLGNIGQTNYSASKAGVIGMTRTWALELAKHGITANVIVPGFFDSALTQQIPPDIKEKFIDKIPLKRIGKPAEMGKLVAFLVSDHAAYITGQTMTIDGGLSLGL